MLLYTTNNGQAYCGNCIDLIQTELEDKSVQLFISSPPFPQVRDRNDYQNPDPNTFVDWLLNITQSLIPKLKSNGSIVFDLGHVYNYKNPTLNIYNYEFIYRVVKELNLNLCFQFFHYNPSSLPSPTAYCNRMKIRPKNSVNLAPWFSITPRPYADVTQVLNKYSRQFKKLLKIDEVKPNDYTTPSGHYIHNDTWVNNKGSIPTNLLRIPNSDSRDPYLSACKSVGIKPHSARFPKDFARFFIKYLTEPNDLVVDIFAGSNTTGFCAEELNRQWKSFELDRSFVAASAFRFINDNKKYSLAYNELMSTDTYVDLCNF